MVFEHIEKLKQELTDKFVVVDETRPELRRFGGLTGHVKTVNMSGRALVQFDAYENIGWFDIDVGFLKVVDGPPPKAEPAAKKAPKKAAAKPAVAPKKTEASPDKKSVAEILAAARTVGKTGETPDSAEPKASPAAKTDPQKMSVAEMLAAARGEKGGGGTAAKAASPTPAAKSKPAPAAAKSDPKTMSVAEMLAAARADKTGGGAAAVESPPPAEETAQADSADESVTTKSESTRVGELPTQTGEIVAWCRQRDAG